MPGHTDEKTMMKMNQALDSGSVVREGEIPMSIEIDGQTRMMTPSEIARLDPGSVVREGEIRDPRTPMTDLEKVQMLMDMGLDQDTAIEAVAMEKNMPPVDPRQFSGQQQAPMQGGTPMPTPTQPPMGALSGVPMGASVPMPMRRPEDLMMRNNPMGQDRTMNPMDRLTPRNAPST
jgi:hypothetical protein